MKFTVLFSIASFHFDIYFFGIWVRYFISNIKKFIYFYFLKLIKELLHIYKLEIVSVVIYQLRSDNFFQLFNNRALYVYI